MKVLDNVHFNELPDFIKEYLYREIGDESLSDDEWDVLKKTLNKYQYELVEYDPNILEDRKILEEFQKQKINQEGNQNQSTIDQIGNDQIIKNPILIYMGSISEGGHRVSASLKYNLKIKAYIV